MIFENHVAWTTYWRSVHSPGYGLPIRYNFGNKIINFFEFKTKMGNFSSKNNNKARDMNSRVMLFARRSAGSFLEQRLVTLIIKIKKCLSGAN